MTHEEMTAALATAERERDEARAELAKERADLAALTARMEIEIPAAAEAVRARAIEECVGRLRELFTQLDGRIRRVWQSDEDFYSRLGHATGGDSRDQRPPCAHRPAARAHRARRRRPGCGGAAMSDRKTRRPLGLAERMQHHEALIALRAFGDAVATIARSQLIAHAAIGRTVRVDMDNPHAERGLELWQRGASLCLSEYAPNRTPRRLWEIEGQPEDIAAEAVARLLAEVGL